MKNKKIKLIFLAIIFFGIFGWTESSLAANHHIRDGATGSSCTDWGANACDSLPATLTRGDIYYVADGSYGSYTFDDAVSGTQYITIKKAIPSDHGSDTGWSNGYGDGQAIFTRWAMRMSYLLIDGQTGGGPGSWETGHGIKVSANDAVLYSGFSDPATSDITFRHIEFSGDGGTNKFTLVYWLGSASDITMQYVYIHDNTCDTFQIRGDFIRFTLEYSEVARNYQDASCHGDVFEYGMGTALDWVHRYNLFKDVVGTYLWGAHGYADTYLDGAKIYGNIIWGGYFDNGMISADSDGGVIQNLKFYDNTIVNSNGLNAGFGYLDRGANNLIYNNMFYSSSPLSMQGTHDYNWFYNSGSQSETHIQNGAGNPFTNIAAGDFTLKSATNAGISLSSPYNLDADGNIRGSDGIWDRGALEYAGVSLPGDTTPPAAPTGLSVN